MGALVVFIPVPMMLTNEVSQLDQAREVLCGGQQNFVYSPTNFPPYLVWSETNDGTGGRLEYTYEVIDSIANKAPGAGVLNLKMGSIMGASWSVEECAAWGPDVAAY